MVISLEPPPRCSVAVEVVALPLLLAAPAAPLSSEEEEEEEEEGLACSSNR